MEKNNKQFDSDQALLWSDRVMEAFRECAIRFNIKRRYPKIPVKFLTSKRRFLSTTGEQLIGTLGWEDQRAFQYVSARTKNAALRWIQEQVSNYAEECQWPQSFVVDPALAKGNEQPVVTSGVDTKIKPSVGMGPLKLPIPYLCTKPRYLGARPKDLSAGRTLKIGDGKHLFMHPQPQPILRDGEIVGSLQRLPWGVICTQLEIYFYNVSRQTHSEYVSWDIPVEIATAIGYTPHDKNYKAILRAIRDMTWCSQKYLDAAPPGRETAINLTPFDAYSLWDLEAAKIDSLGRRNPGRRRISTMQKTLVPSFVVLSKTWLSHVALAYEHADVNMLNMWVKSPLRYMLYLKSVEWGTRDQDGVVPLWGPDGLIEELGLGNLRRDNARASIKRTMAAVKKDTECPHELLKDSIRFHPWWPLYGLKPHKVPVPEATKRLMSQSIQVDDLNVLRDESLTYLEHKVRHDERDTE